MNYFNGFFTFYNTIFQCTKLTFKREFNKNHIINRQVRKIRRYCPILDQKPALPVPGLARNFREVVDTQVMSMEDCDNLRYTRGHFFCFSVETLSYLLTKAGFEMEEVGYSKDDWNVRFSLDGREYVTAIAKKPWKTKDCSVCSIL